MGYLICDKCNGYYELQPGEKPEDFDLECDCGGKYYFSESLEGIKEDFVASEATITCPHCGTGNPEDAKLCKSCKKFLIPIKTPPKTDKTTKRSEGGIFGWWHQQSTAIKAGSIIGVCIIGLILIFGIGAMLAPQETNTSSSSSQPTTTATPSQQPSTASQQPITFSGTGTQTTQKFSWNGGAARFDIQYTAGNETNPSNFVVNVLNSEGKTQQVGVANTAGSYSGTRVVNLPNGSYYLDVIAKGSWTITVAPA